MSARKTRNMASSQSIAAEHVQRATTRVYNEAALDPSLVVSPYINAWLEEHSRVYMYDPVGMLQYILSLASFLGEDNYVFRNNRKKTPTTLYLSLCTRPAYGKSDLFQATKDSIINLLCIRQGFGVYGRSNNRKAKTTIQMPDLNAFADELTRLGLLSALEKAPRLLLFDELDQLFIRNGLIPLPNSTQNENNFYEIALQLYSDNCLFSKHTSSSETTFQSKRMCIMGNHTQEPCNRLVLRKLNGEGPNPFFERHVMLCARTPVTEEKFNPDMFNYKQFASFDQLSMTISFLVVLDFYFDDDGRALAISFCNSLMREMREIESSDSWLCARLGKSREHTLRLAACLQVLELAFYLLENYRIQYGNFGSGLADDQFHERMLIIASEFLKRQPLPDYEDRIKVNPVAIEIHNDCVRGAINYVQIIIRQYYLLFVDLDGTTNMNNTVPIRKQQMAIVPNTMATKLCPLIQVNNQSNIDTYEDVNEDQINYHHIDNQLDLTNKSISSNMRHHAHEKNMVLQHLVLQNFLIEIKGGLKGGNVRSTAIDIWVKCMPPSSDDLSLIQKWDEELSVYDVTWNQYESTLCKIKPMEDLYMTNSLNAFINENYSTISMFISDDILFTLVPPNIENISVSCVAPSSALKTTSDLGIEIDQQEEHIENIEFNDQDDENEEENSLVYQKNDTISSHQQQNNSSSSLPRNAASSKPLKQQSIVFSFSNNPPINNNLQRQQSRSSIDTPNFSIQNQWKTPQPKEPIANLRGAYRSLPFNMMHHGTTTSIARPQFPTKTTLSSSSQQMQQQFVRNASAATVIGSGLNNLHHEIESAEPSRSAFELMSTRLLQSERNRKTATKDNTTFKK